MLLNDETILSSKAGRMVCRTIAHGAFYTGARSTLRVLAFLLERATSRSSPRYRKPGPADQGDCGTRTPESAALTAPRGVSDFSPSDGTRLIFRSVVAFLMFACDGCAVPNPFCGTTHPLGGRRFRSPAAFSCPFLLSYTAVGAGGRLVLSFSLRTRWRWALKVSCNRSTGRSA